MIDKRAKEIEQQERERESGNQVEDRTRLMKLASFQTKLLCHAMSLKPKLIIYSTCRYVCYAFEYLIDKYKNYLT